MVSCMELQACLTVDTIANSKDTSSRNILAENRLLLVPFHRNVIKFNPTPMLIWGDIRNITFSYERLIKENQSVCFLLGFFSMPRVFNDTIAMVTILDESRKGINIAFDYRYYPGARNRRPAPDGLYLGGYLSYYGFQLRNDFSIPSVTENQAGSTTVEIHMVNLGVELGYQFIFWKRFSVDLLLFGPSLTYQSGSMEISGQLTPEQIEQLDQEMIDKILNRFPALGFLGSNESLKFTGSRTSLHTFFRYSIQLGFHF
jgi:hypothetical protein